MISATFCAVKFAHMSQAIGIAMHSSIALGPADLPKAADSTAVPIATVVKSVTSEIRQSPAYASPMYGGNGATAGAARWLTLRSRQPRQSRSWNCHVTALATYRTSSMLTIAQ